MLFKKKNENEIIANQVGEIVKKFENLETENAEAFRAIISKYSARIFDSMPWSELWEDEPYIESGFAKAVPFITPFLIIILGLVQIFLITRK